MGIIKDFKTTINCNRKNYIRLRGKLLERRISLSDWFNKKMEEEFVTEYPQSPSGWISEQKGVSYEKYEEAA